VAFDDGGFGVVSLKAKGKAILSGTRGETSGFPCLRIVLRGTKLAGKFECSDYETEKPSKFMSVLSILAIIMFGVVLLIGIGWLARFRSKLAIWAKSGRSPNSSVDPSAILREDQISELVNIEPVEEENPVPAMA
jgi:hypothetical protein